MPANVEAWRRGALMGGAALGAFAFWRFSLARTWTRWLWLAFAGAVAVAFVFVFGGDFALGGAVAVVFSVSTTGAFIFGAGAGAGTGAGAFAVAFACVVALAGASVGLGPGVAAGATAGAFGGATAAALASMHSIDYERQGAFLSLFSALMVAAALASARYAGAFAGPVALFLGLLTLMNAPYDWLSVGVTRGLLRRGVELGGLWPYALGFVDLALALVLVAGLAAAMVIGVQAFDYLAALSGAAPILPLAPLFAGIEKDPGAPEYWWIYATLFSTLIPSIFNLVMGSWSLARGLPLLSAPCASRMPENAATPIYDRAWIAALLTLQWLFGLLLTLAGIAALGWALLSFYPQIGAVFLDWAEFVASWNLPQRASEWALRMLGR